MASKEKTILQLEGLEEDGNGVNSVRLWLFKKGDLVLATQKPMVTDKKKGKVELNLEGPLVIKKVYSNRAYLLKTVEHGPIIAQMNP